MFKEIDASKLKCGFCLLIVAIASTYPALSHAQRPVGGLDYGYSSGGSLVGNIIIGIAVLFGLIYLIGWMDDKGYPWILVPLAIVFFVMKGCPGF